MLLQTFLGTQISEHLQDALLTKLLDQFLDQFQFQLGVSSLCQTLIKIKDNREMVGKICPNMKMTPPCNPLPQYN